jgi:hypothetical protein
MNIKFLSKYKWYFFLLFSIIIGYWQLSFMLKIMKWDMMMYYFPMKYYIGECLSNGFLPLWNPHQFLGFPIHSDPQSSVFYPVTWLIGGTVGYNFYTINFDFLLHIYIAGCGMLLLGKQLKLKGSTSFLMATSYIFCGLFIGNAQHLSWVVSAAWIPFIIASVLKLINTKSYFVSIKLGFYISLFLTGGYSGFFIILFYVLFGLIIYYIIKFIRNKAFAALKRLAKNIGLMSVSFLLFSSGYLISVVKVLPYFSRSSSLSIERIMQNSFTLKSFISFIFPFAITTEFDYWGTGISMANAYFGLVSIIFIILSLFIKNNTKQIVLILLGLLFISISLGNELPLREFLYNYFPGMNLFRHPSIFRYFAILSFILCFGLTFNTFTISSKRNRNYLLYISICVLAIVLLFVILNLNNLKPHLFCRYSTNWVKMKPYINNSISENIIVQAIIHIGILILFIFITFKFKSEKLLKYGMLLILIIDMIAATQLNISSTVISNRNFAPAQNAFEQLPNGFSIKNFKNEPIQNAKPEKSNALNIYGIYSNLNIFDKQIGFDGYNPFQLTNYESFKKSNYFEPTIKNNLVYLSNSIYLNNKSNIGISPKTKDLSFNSKEFTALSKLKLASNTSDSLNILTVEPNTIKIESRTKEQQILTLLQNNYPGWRVTVNGKKTEHYTSNHAFISCVLPAGKNIIEYHYTPKLEKFGFIISIITAILFIFYSIIRGLGLKRYFRQI